jgi:hypothetical protein
MFQRHAALALASGVVLLATACSDQNEPAAPTGPDAASRAISQGRPDDPNALARGVRGFGGFFYDEAGTPTMYLSQSAQRGAAEQAMAPYLQRHGVAAGRIQVRQGRFGWDELESWKTRISSEALGVPGAVFVDANEAVNQVTVGVERGKGGQVRAALARMGLPTSAVAVQETDPVTFAVGPRPKRKPGGSSLSLQGRVRPTRGGVQINFPGYLCTLGFNAQASGTLSFITNSHCTENQGGVDDTPYWQPLQSVDGTQIAVEVADPVYKSTLSGCPGGRVCRLADASRARYMIGSSNVALGRIARTERPGRNLTIVGDFSITAEGSATVGQTVNKVGRTTGWSQGRVTNSCVTTNVSGSDHTEICQNFVSATVGSGDSGSPVFIISGGNNVTLVGILWGGSGSSSFVYSPLTNIEQELGSLTTY